MFANQSVPQIFTIKFVATKNCFISLPRTYTQLNSNQLNAINIFKLSSLASDKQCYVSWSGEFSSQPSCVQINSLFGEGLNLRDGEEVILTRISPNERTADCRRILIRPVTGSDWEILSLNSNFIENNLLNQIRVTTSNLLFPIWLNQGNVCVVVEACKSEPDQCDVVVLQKFTEVVVIPNAENDPRSEGNNLSRSDRNSDGHEVANQSRQTDQSKTMMSVINSVFKFLSTDNPPEDTNDKVQVKEEIKRVKLFCDIEIEMIFRVDPFGNENSSEGFLNSVFISDLHFDKTNQEYFIGKLINVLSPSQRSKVDQKAHEKESSENQTPFSEETFKETSVIVFPNKSCQDSRILVPNCIRRQLGLSISSRVLLKSISCAEVPLIHSLTLHPIGVSSKMCKNSTQISKELEDVLNKSKIQLCVLCKGTLLTLNENSYLIDHDNEQSYVGINKDSLKSLKFEMGKAIINPVKTSWGLNLPLSNTKEIDEKSNFCPTLSYNPIGGFDDLVAKCFLFIKNALNIDPLSRNINSNVCVMTRSLLISGQKGSGKSSLINFVVNKIKEPPNYVFVQIIDCKSLKGKRVEMIQKSWFKLLREFFYRTPSVIVFEDLDVICTTLVKPEQEASADLIYYERIASIFINIMRVIENFSYENGLAIIATCKSHKMLHPSIVQPRGRHIFGQFLEIEPPVLSQRIEMLSAAIYNRLKRDASDLNLNQIALQSEGFLPFDLSSLADRAIHNCSLRTEEVLLNSDNFILKYEDFTSAFQGFSPISLRNVNLHEKSSKKWNNIGGLKDLKKSLIQTLLWPCRYPNLFAKLPLKQQSGILLFGAPGTGKTLLAEAVANECSMNFISIKGPELLSKYIGASESAVRDVFSRAHCAKPCIIFFDEFDSIAPRRGHDSTGVTDRVVNQLLTQMDGVEALQNGIYILAASSRPDLLDPALLRPGRFDKCLYCPLPDQIERLEILQVLSAQLILGSDADLDSIASATQHFTGADLQSLLYSAQLDAFYDYVNDTQRVRNQSEFEASGYEDQLRVDGRNEHEFLKTSAIDQTFKSNFISTDVDELDSYDKNNSKEVKIEIYQKHLLAALNKTSPSVNEKERRRYDKIYQTFLDTRGQFFQDLSTGKPKVTLA